MEVIRNSDVGYADNVKIANGMSPNKMPVSIAAVSGVLSYA